MCKIAKKHCLPFNLKDIQEILSFLLIIFAEVASLIKKKGLSLDPNKKKKKQTEISFRKKGNRSF